MRGKALLLYCVCCLIWGSTWMVIKIGLVDLPPFLFAGCRMAVACGALAPLAWRRAPRVTRGEWRAVVLVGFLQIGLSYALVFTAQKTIDSGLTATLFATFPIWVGLFAHLLLFGEPFTLARVAAALAGLLGVATLEAPAFRAFLGRGPALGPALGASLLPLAAAFVSGFSNVWMKKRLSGVSPPANLWGQTMVGALFLLGLHFALEAGDPVRWTPRAFASLFYLSILGTVVTFLALFWLIPRVPMATIGAIPLIDTLIAVGLGHVVLAEPLGWRLLAGGALILGGAALANLAGPAPAAVAGAEP